MVNVKKWRFWQFFDHDGALRWVGVSRPNSHRKIDRTKIWTLLPSQQVLVANWFLMADQQLPEAEREWVHDSIDGWDFCDAAIEVPEPSRDDLARLTRPEAELTLDQIDRIPMEQVTGLRDRDRILRERKNE
ncbi:MAG: hypothetical protein WAW85_02950 [Gordonia sp. (in: high G+C Gram-positive bacteria)]|uniref:hypothetical protein n=1 Tax=Gordonia sp. (in: high G+C Gram-positive bacteria) TaxID=84139 RepID=UPI003BB7D3C4